MARKPNYGFEKRQKELDRKNKKEEKLKRREEGRDDGASSEPGFDEYGRPITVLPGTVAGTADDDDATESDA